MGEIKVTQWECDVCKAIYDNEGEYRHCIKEHALDNELTVVGGSVVIDIGGLGAPSYMGGPMTDGTPEYVMARVVDRRMKDGEPQALVEHDGERTWRSAWVLKEWAMNKQAIEERKTRPILPPGSSAAVIVTYRSYNVAPDGTDLLGWPKMGENG